MHENDKTLNNIPLSNGDTQENKVVEKVARTDLPVKQKKSVSVAANKKKPGPPVKKKEPEKEKKRLSVFKERKIKTSETGEELKYKSHKAIYSVTLATIYIVLIVIASVIASYFIISIGNDVFALKKDERSAEIELGMYPTVIDVTNALAENGIIRYPGIFKMYARLKLDEGDVFIPGTYTVSSTQNYSSLINTFLEQTGERRIVTITIPEGYTIDEIINLFLKFFISYFNFFYWYIF